MDLGISGKSALVTGASRGIGRSTCVELANNGVNIVAVARNGSELDSLGEQIGSGVRFTPIVLDLTIPSNLEKLFAFIHKQNIEISIIVNNLGGQLNITDPLDQYINFEKVMYLNLGVAVEINRHFVPSMVKNKWGRICHLSSIAAIENQGPPSYCAAKSALNAYVRSVGRFLAEENVILNGVMPGAIRATGNYWDDATINRPEYVENYLRTRMSIKRFGTLDEVTKIISFLVSEHASFMVGTMVLADGGQGRSFEHIES
jgi:3-oxoacyl-[acyl-carrier protein] reductase